MLLRRHSATFSIIPRGNFREVLTNLTFLTAHDSEHPEQVLKYMALADEQLQAFAQVLRQYRTYN
jgi:hypothetical protein